MNSYVRVGDLIVNLANVVAFDIDGNAITKIWYAGSPTPVVIQAPGVAAAGFLQFLQAKGFLVT